MENRKRLYSAIQDALLDYRSALARNAGISAAKERIKNLLFNTAEDIVNHLRNEDLLQREVDNLKEQLAVMESELEEVDEENSELRKKVRELETAEPPKKRKTKTMTAVVE